jgi:phosphoesterase RecJ-like protein
MLAQTSTTEIDTDAFVPYTLSIQGVQIGLMFTEMEDGVKINFRSKGDIWINQLAKQFGGNGHKNAAGGRVGGVSLQEVIPQVLEQARIFLR